MNQTTVNVTGTLTGIGRITALTDAKFGVNVVVSERPMKANAALASELRTLDGEAKFAKAGVAIEAEIRGLVEKTVSLFCKQD